MRQLYLHAGLPKTGTTLLQALFLGTAPRSRPPASASGRFMNATGSHLPGFVEAIERAARRR